MGSSSLSVGMDWQSGKTGSLSPWSQAVAVALLKMRALHKVKLSYEEIAHEVTKVGGGHPTRQAIALLHGVVQADSNWYPGKVSDNAAKRGPKIKFTLKKQRAVANSAMALKNAGIEPTVPKVVAQCPAAALNPSTGEPFSPNLILDVFRSLCYDLDPEHPWKFVTPYQKTALPSAAIQARFTWAQHMKRMKRKSGWYHQNCIWMDPCNTVIPAAKRTIFDQDQAAKGRHKRWMSQDTRKYSRNLKASSYAGKQKQWADKRAWWILMLAKGRVILQLMPIDWEQTGPGIADVIDELPQWLRTHFGSQCRLPKVLITDRGPGFYQASSGTIVAAYKEALARNGFKAFAGAAKQKLSLC